jgi:D-inositol-3-phosphate glycosyltransferase
VSTAGDTEGLHGLVRAIDARTWRHVYSVGEPAAEGLRETSELGALVAREGPGLVALHLETDGRLVTETYDATARRPRPLRSVRWMLAPLAWPDVGGLSNRVRRVLARVRRFLRRPWAPRRQAPARGGPPAGYLYAADGPARLPLFSAIHPITGDQLLSTRNREAAVLGYSDAARLGYLVAAAPLTGVLGWRRALVPWADRPGVGRRSGPAGARGALSQPADFLIPRDALRISGWAVLAGESVSRVDVIVDGAFVGRARIGIQRPMVEADGNPEAAIAGFDLRISPSRLPPEGSLVMVEAIAVGERGSRLTLAPEMPIELAAPMTMHREDSEAAAKPGPRSAPTRIVGADAGTADAGPGSSPTAAGRRIRVGAFAHSLDIGGAQRTLFEQLHRLTQSGDFEAQVVAPRAGPLEEQLGEIGVPVRIAGEFAIEGRDEYERRVADVAAWIGAGRVDAVLANTIGAFIGVDAATRLGLPSVWIIHESYELPIWWQIVAGARTPDLYVRGRCTRALGHTDAAIFPADATRALYAPYVDSSRMFTAPCGVEFAAIDAFRRHEDRREVRESLSIDPGSRLILSLGMIEARKGQSVLARAWTRVHRDHPGAELALVGAADTPYCNGLRRYIEEAGIAQRCRLVEATMDTLAWHLAADLFVLPSDVESAPVVLAEAMGFETPVVATDVFGIPELITDGRDGFLCEPNDVDDLARVLDRILRLDRDRLAAVGARGSRRAREHHDPDRFAERLAGLLTGLVRDRERAPAWG